MTSALLYNDAVDFYGVGVEPIQNPRDGSKIGWYSHSIKKQHTVAHFAVHVTRTGWLCSA